MALVGSSIACNLRQCRICRLLDHHCFAGVAAGECERNYKFMVGSDSLGRCRRSCKACEACAAHDKACCDRNRHRAGYLVTAEDEE
jgi:prolyl 4-hydroxylase